jgi:hypothetical protein
MSIFAMSVQLGRVSRFKGAMLGRSMIALAIPWTPIRRGGETPAERHRAQGNDQNRSHGLASSFDPLFRLAVAPAGFTEEKKSSSGVSIPTFPDAKAAR